MAFPSPDFSILTRCNEEAKKSFVSQRFVDALRLYDEGLEKTFDEHPETLSALLEIANDGFVGSRDCGVHNLVRAAVISAFILRLKPFYFEATTTFVRAITTNVGAASANDDDGATAGKLASRRRGAGVEAARIVLKRHLAKDGTDEDAKKLLDSLKDDVVVEEVEEKATTTTTIGAAATPAVLDDVPAEFATAVGNALNNSALCELKLQKFEAAAASASQALLFLSSKDARAKAIFRHAQALLRRSGNASSSEISSLAEAEEAMRAAEQHLKKAEAKVLRGIWAEAKGKHDWTSLLKECLKDEKKVIDPTEYLSPKIAVGNSPTKGLGLIAKESVKKGEILSVQRAVHYVPPKAAADNDEHLDFPKTLLAAVLNDARNEAALRILALKGRRIDEKRIPTIAEAFRRVPSYLAYLRDQMSATQLKEEVKRRGEEQMPLSAYEGTAEYERESRRLASLVSDVVKKVSRQSTSLALSFDVRYKKTMTQSGGEPELGQLGLWTIPSLLHHAEFPNVIFGTMGGVAIVTAIRDVEVGTPLAAMMGGIQCLPERLRHLTSMGLSFPEGFDPDHPLKPAEAEIVAETSATFEEANGLKMETVGMDPGEAKPLFEKAIDVCLKYIGKNKTALERADPLGLAALYFTLADCLGGKKDLSGMVKAYFMGIQSAHGAIVVSLDTLTRMTKMQKFLPMAKKLEEMQDQAEMVAKNNPSLREEFKKISIIKEIGPSIGKIQDYLEENLTKGCALVFSTDEALRLLS